MSYSIADLIAQIEATKVNPQPVTVLPELPEFAFSPRCERVEAAPAFRSGIAPFEGPMAPPKPLAYGAPVTGLSQAEKTWRQMGTVFPHPVVDHQRPPKGTAPTLEGLQRYLKRMEDYEAEWRAIAATQDMELPTVGQELAQTGVSSFSISSSDEDDDSELTMEVSAEETERLACRYGTAYLTTELAPLARRIEWERFAYNCGPAQRVWIATAADGSLSVKTDSHTLTKEDILPMARRLKAALDGRDADALANDRARVAHYGVIGSILYGVKSGDHAPEQSFDILGAEEHEENESNGGPQELGLHTLTEYAVDYEPTAQELWPQDYPSQTDYPEDPDPSWLPDEVGA